MIKAAWTLIATLCIANFAAIAALIIWLAATDRVSPERIQTLRTTFAPTVAQQAAADEAQRLEAQRLAEQFANDAERGTYPLDTETVMELWNQRDTEARQRYQREITALNHLRESVDQRREALEAETRRFEQRVRNFEQQREAALERKASEQFQQAVKLLSLTDPATARRMLQTLLDLGQEQQVTNYLDALKPDIAQPIIADFAENDPELAAQLLERIRALGEEDQGNSGAQAQAPPPPAP